MKLAEEIRVELARQQQPERWLARQTGISFNYMNTRLRGERPFTTSDLRNIAAALGVPPAELWRRAEKSA